LFAKKESFIQEKLMETERREWELRNLIERIEKIERQNLRLKQAGLLILLLFVSAFVAAQVKPKTPKAPPVKAAKALEAGKFVLQDGRGRKKAELGLIADRPALVFYDEQGERTLSLGVDSDGAGLTVYDGAAQEAAILSYTPGGPVLSLMEAGRKRLNLSVTPQGPALGLVGRNNEARAALGLTGEDQSFLHLFNAGERGGAQLLAAPDRTVLRFFDASDKARAVLGIVDKESAPGLVLNDELGIARSILMLTAERGPNIEFFDQNRSRIWTAR